MELELTNRILKNREYQRVLSQLREMEADRVFCRHDIQHFLDVARLAVILCNDWGVSCDRDIIYAAALLHDIGRVQEMQCGIPHDIAGQAVADVILSDISCPDDAKKQIISLIASHRSAAPKKSQLEQVFCEADKRSRSCYCCAVQAMCNWSEDKKNLDIEV